MDHNASKNKPTNYQRRDPPTRHRPDEDEEKKEEISSRSTRSTTLNGIGAIQARASSTSSRDHRKQPPPPPPSPDSTMRATERALLDAQAKARARRPTNTKVRQQPRRAMPTHLKSSTSSNSTKLQRLQEEVTAKERGKVIGATKVQRKPPPSMHASQDSSTSIGSNLSAIKQLNRMEADIAIKERVRMSRGQGAKRNGSSTTRTVSNRLDRMEADIAAKERAKAGRVSAARRTTRTSNRNEALARKLQKARALTNAPATTPGAVSSNGNSNSISADDAKKKTKQSVVEGNVIYGGDISDDKKRKKTAKIYPTNGAVDLDATKGSIDKNMVDEKNDKNNKLAVAVAVQEDENVFIPAAVEYDPDAVSKLPMYKKQRFRVYSLLSCTIFIIIAACSITVLTLLEKQQAAQANMLPSEAPTCLRCTGDFIEVIELEVGKAKLSDPTSPEYMAKEWIIHEDPMQLWPTDKAFIQRYLLAAFYFDTHQIADWRSCNRQSLDPASNETEQCDFLKVTGIKPLQFQPFASNRWLSSISECTWAGVICDDYEMVRRIDLHGQAIQGTLPVSFSRFPFVQTLSMQLNNLVGTLPEEWGRLKHVIHIELHGNQLTGTFPGSWSNIRNLQQLNLAENQLTGQLPSTIGNFRTIKGLYLFDNKFSGTIPPEIANANSLSYIRFQKNLFTGSIPPEIVDMQLVELWLHKNPYLSGTLPDELGKLSNYLTDMRLSKTAVGGQIPDSITELTQLSRFTAGGAQFTGTLPANISKLENLQFFEFNENGLTGNIPSGMDSMTNLVEFEVAGNFITGNSASELCFLRENHRLRFLTMDCLGDNALGIDPEIPCECCDLCCDAGMNCQQAEPPAN